MEQLKKLSINTALCDMTEITEEVLSSYSELNVNAAAVLLSERASVLISRYSVKLNTASTLKVPEGINTIVKNGSVEIDGTDVTADKTLLMVNGTLLLRPAAEKAMENYVQIKVNGSLLYPKSLAGQVSRIHVNGHQKCYPDNAVCILKDLTVDKYFIIRAVQNTPYFITGKVSITDPSLDLSTLIHKNVTLLCEKALVMESFFEQALSLFDENTDISVIPDGFSLLPDNMELNEFTLAQLGKKLIRTGDLYITDKNMEVLPSLESLKVTGTVYLPEKYSKEFLKFPVEYGKISLTKGTLISDKSNLHIDKQLLEQTPEGLHVMDCATVEIDKDVPGNLARECLYLEDCALIKCPPELKSIIELISSDVASISDYTEETEGSDEKNDDTVYINAATYKF